MRLHILSDIHDDYSRASLGNYQIPVDLDADAIIIAGDIAGRLSRMGRAWLEAQRDRTGLPIVLVAGNHDYWRGTLDREIQRFRDRLQRSDIHILDGEELILGDTRFVGGTLWTDYLAWHGDNYHAMRDALTSMNDFRYIRTDGYRRRLQPWMLAEEHERHLSMIASILDTSHDGPTVVVTHHAPSPRSLNAGRATQPIDASYASDLESLIRFRGPDLWIHGHIHRRLDYGIGATRIVCNPRGYRHGAHGRRQPAEIETPEFDPRLIIVLDDDRPLVGGHNVEHALARPDAFQWPYGRAPELVAPDEEAIARMRERAARGDPEAALRILNQLPNLEEDDG